MTTTTEQQQHNNICDSVLERDCYVNESKYKLINERNKKE